MKNWILAIFAFLMVYKCAKYNWEWRTYAFNELDDIYWGVLASRNPSTIQIFGIWDIETRKEYKAICEPVPTYKWHFESIGDGIDIEHK